MKPSKPTFQPTAEMIEAAGKVFLCKALVSTVRPMVLRYQSAILHEGQWPTAERWSGPQQARSPVLDPESVYLLEDADLAKFIELCNQERNRLGLKVSRPGNCPLLEAREDLRQAGNHLVELMEPITGITLEKLIGGLPQHLDQYIEMTLRLFAPHINVQDILSGMNPHKAAG